MKNSTWKQKSWMRNMTKIFMGYQHKSESVDMRFIHMNEKCRIDRIGVYPRVWRFK